MLLKSDGGLFIVSEGIDGSGEDTQLEILYRLIKSLDKYQDVLLTHEPWKNEEIKRRLQEEKDAYSNAEEMAHLYIGDRTEHTYVLVRPNVSAGVIVLCSRYMMSTCAFQQAQGMSLDRLLKLHERQHNGVLKPDLTLWFDVKGEVAAERRQKRGVPPEKFEHMEFLDKANENYRALYEMSRKNSSLFGRVERIDANPDILTVAKSVEEAFLNLYYDWLGDFRWGLLPQRRRETGISSEFQSSDDPGGAIYKG